MGLLLLLLLLLLLPSSLSQTNVFSLDAINPNLPHRRGNVQWVCLRINLGGAGALHTERGVRIYSRAHVLQANSCTPTPNSGTGLIALPVDGPSMTTLHDVPFNLRL